MEVTFLVTRITEEEKLMVTGGGGAMKKDLMAILGVEGTG